jgi:hypothetical protein
VYLHPLPKNHILKYLKNENNISVYIYALYVHFEEKILYVACVKKKIRDPKIAIDVVFLSFLHKPKRNVVSPQNFVG